MLRRDAEKRATSSTDHRRTGVPLGRVVGAALGLGGLGLAALALAAVPRDMTGRPDAVAVVPPTNASGTDEAQAAGTDGGDFPLVPRRWRALDEVTDDHRLQVERRAPSPGLEACGSAVDPAEGARTRRAQLTGPEDFRARNLVTTRTAPAAGRYFRDISRLYDRCPQESHRPFVTYYEGRTPSGLGQQSVNVAGIWATEQSSPAPGLETVAVVRVGRAVMVDARYTEDVYSEAQLRLMMRDQRMDLREAVAAMCRFTRTGC